MARVRLLRASDIEGEQRGFVESLDARGGFINLYRAIAHSPAALERLCALVATLWAGSLSARVREIAILTVVAESKAAYPLGWHILDAAEAGLTEWEIRAAVSGDASAALAAGEIAVVLFARSLTNDARVDDAVFDAVREFLGEHQVVELALLCGLYRAVAAIANGLNVDIEGEPAQALDRFGFD